MKLTKGMKLRDKIKFATAKILMIAVTGRTDLRRDESFMELIEALDKKLDQLGAIDPDRSDQVKEWRKEWDKMFAPQRKTVKCKVYMDKRCYERMCMYAAGKEARGYVENNDIDGLEAMLQRKMDELEALQKRLEDILDEDS